MESPSPACSALQIDACQAPPKGRSHSLHGLPKQASQQQGIIRAPPTILSRASHMVSEVHSNKGEKDPSESVWSAQTKTDGLILRRNNYGNLMKGTSFKGGYCLKRDIWRGGIFLFSLSALAYFCTKHFWLSERVWLCP